MFSAVEPEEVRRLVGRGELASHSLGETILGGDRSADAFYVLLSGRVRMLATRAGKEYVVATLNAPAHFGEEAVLAKSPHHFTVRAASDTSVLKIPADSFREFLRTNPELDTYLKRYVNEVSIRAFLKLFTLMTTLSARQIKTVLDQLGERSYAKDEFVFREGDQGDSFYIVRSGRVEILRERNGQSARLRELREGDFFGELALLYGDARTASVRCLEDTETFRLDRKDFDQLVEQAPEVKQQILEAVSHYHLEESLRQKWGLREDRPVEPPRISASEEEPDPAPAAETVRPPFRFFGKYPFLRQHDQSDCGAASLAMILRYWGRRISLSRLRDMANVSREGASLLSVAEAAEQLGFSARGMRLDYRSLTRAPLPAIAHWQGNHYIVVYRAGPHRVLVADPGIGLRNLTVAEFQKGWTGHVLILTPTPELTRTDDQVPSLRRFLPFLKPLRWVLFEIFLATLILDLLGLASPVFTQTIVDRVLVHHSVGLLNVMALGMVVVLLFEVLVTASRQYLLIHGSNKLDLSLLIVFYRHMLGLPVDYFEKRRIGDFIARFRETARIRQMITGTAITTILDSLMVVVYLGLMLYYNVKLTMLMLAFVPLFALLTWSFTPYLKRVNREVFSTLSDASSFLIESINGVHTVKSMAIERGVRQNWEGLYVKGLNASFSGQLARVAVDALSTLLNRGSSLVLLYYGALLVIRGELTVGQLMAFNVLLGSVMGPISRLIGLWDEVQETMIAVERLNDVLDSDLEQKDAERLRLRDIKGRIKLENVTFRYGTREDRNILSNVDLEIYPGQTVALVGRSGSGKTTLAKLIMGMYEPTEGRILVDGHDLRSVDLVSYRKQLGVVMQDAFLFSGTIKENIALGDPEPNMERVISASILANAHDFIGAMPLSYETVVGERGMSLSGGQRQRLTIARALYSDPRVLVLDEATSNLDVESERAIQSHFERVLADRTAIVIAHRLSTVQDADLIVVLDQGVIVETGTHRALMEQKGLYYYLNGQQLQL
ncbi:MAG: peptidase domain-containing ABC transporter [Armatimonadetes bacterium]|nr:peptidase domain-containing ABC transporter [Armatimonadota bacterium]